MVSITMVNPNELVDLDPELEDILSVWGKEPTTQNVEWYFGGYELSRLEPPPQVSLETKPSSLWLSKETDRNSLRIRNQTSFQQPFREDTAERASNAAHFLGNRGKSISGRNFLSGGIEDIVNLWLASGLGKARAS